MMKYVAFLLLPLWVFALNNPSNLVLVPTSHSVSLTWQDNATDETGYRILRNGEFLAFLPQDSTSYVDTNLPPNTTYTYTVKATDASLNTASWIRTNPGAGGTIAVIGATADDTVVVAADLSGVYLREHGASTFSVKGEVNGLLNTTHMSALGFHPTDGKTFYVGTGGGVYKTIDKGEHFDFITTLSYNDYNDTYVEDIAVAPSNSDIVYVTHHSWDNDKPSHIDRSTDGGVTWSDVSLTDAARLRLVKLVVHPKNPNVVYAIAGKPRWGCSAAKAYVTTNGGTSWMTLEDKGDVVDIDVDPLHENVVYMSTFHAAPCLQNLFEEISMDDYILDGGEGALYRSDDYGSSFGDALINKSGIISVDTTNGQNVKLINIMTMASAFWMKDDDDYGVNYTGSWITTNGGATWTHHGDVANWHVAYSDNPYVKFGFSFNGISKTLTKNRFDWNKLYGANSWTMETTDGGATFHPLATVNVAADRWRSTGLENIIGFALDVNDADNNVIYMGGYDIGLWLSKDRGASWKWLHPYKWHNSDDDDTLELQNKYTWGATTVASDPSILKQIGGSNTLTLISDPSDASKIWSSFARAQSYADADINATHPQMSERSGLFKSEDFGESWTLSTLYKKDGSILSPFDHIKLYGLSIDMDSDSDNRTLYVTINGDLAKSTDDGLSWHVIEENGGLKFTAVRGASVYAGGESGLWRLKNGNWTRMGGALQDEMAGVRGPMNPEFFPQDNVAHYDQNDDKIIDIYAWNGVSSIAIDPNNAQTVYVTVFSEVFEPEISTPNYVTKGLYRSDDGGDSWSRVSLGAFENRYLRYVHVHPSNADILFVSSSQSINSGGKAGTSNGIIYSTDRGETWQELNNGMVWKYAINVKVDSSGERIWSWSPGTGVQYTDIIQ